MKIQLNLSDWPDDFHLYTKIDMNTLALVFQKSFHKVPYMPAKGMKIDIRSFIEERFFSPDELEFLRDHSFWEVSEIYMHLNFLELELLPL